MSTRIYKTRTDRSGAVGQADFKDIHSLPESPLEPKSRALSRPDDVEAYLLPSLELMADVVTLLDTHRGHVRVFFEHIRDLPADEQRNVRRKRDEIRANVTETLERGIASGEFSPTLDPKLAAWGVLGMVNWTYQWYRENGRYSSREIAERFHAMLIEGIGRSDQSAV